MGFTLESLHELFGKRIKEFLGDGELAPRQARWGVSGCNAAATDESRR